MEDDDENLPEPDGKGVLILSNRAWLNLDPSIWAMASKIIKLDISYNHIVELPNQIGEMMMLRELIACYNKLEYIPPSLGRLKRLRRLVLNSNRLKTVPAELGNLDVLEELFLSENSLEEFPNSIAKIPNLRVIKLANNKLKDLPYELADLLSLEDIDCANNPHLQTVPESWRNDSQSILFICRIHRDYNIRMQEMIISNQDLTKHAQQVEQDNLLLKEKVLAVQAQIDELYKNMPKSVLKKMEAAAEKAREAEGSTEIENEKKKNQCIIS